MTILPLETAIDRDDAGAQSVKFLQDGQIIIRRGDKTYNLQGQEVR